MKSPSRQFPLRALLLLLFIQSLPPLNAFVSHSFTSKPLRHSGHPLRVGILQQEDTTTSSATGEKIPISKASSTIEIIPPSEPFRDTRSGEVSIVSFNMLAPFYASLGEKFSDIDKRQAFLDEERTQRVPLAIDMATATNADILCLQEVEGGPEHEPNLRQLLLEKGGYDQLIWTPLLPKRVGDIVGLCIAWKSKRHNLVESDCYSRAMICQLEDIETNAKVTMANVHLPAKPSNVLGRLKTMSRTIQKLSRLSPSSSRRNRCHPLDGLVVVTGDFNCNERSVTVKLLQTGYSPYGTLRDRNYKAKLTKASASQMRHDFNFQDVYGGSSSDGENDSLRQQCAPVTVSLHGREPGSMDQFHYHIPSTQQKKARRPLAPPKAANPNAGRGQRRRTARRIKAAHRMTRSTSPTVAISQLHGQRGLLLEAVLATVLKDDTERMELIEAGLPNVPQGFPSDHMPIGALFAPDPEFVGNDSPRPQEPSNCNQEQLSTAPFSNQPDQLQLLEDTTSSTRHIGGVSSSVQRRRQASVESIGFRRRHNAVLGFVHFWLSNYAEATSIVRDQTLYKNPMTRTITSKNFKKKSRAPDLMCVISNTLIIVEIAVAANPKSIREQKITKYSDLPEILASCCDCVLEEGWSVHPSPLAIVVDKTGRIPQETRDDIRHLIQLSGVGLSSQNDRDVLIDQETQRFCNQLQASVDDCFTTAIT